MTLLENYVSLFFRNCSKLPQYLILFRFLKMKYREFLNHREFMLRLTGINNFKIRYIEKYNQQKVTSLSQILPWSLLTWIVLWISLKKIWSLFPCPNCVKFLPEELLQKAFIAPSVSLRNSAILLLHIKCIFLAREMFKHSAMVRMQCSA